MSDEPLFGCSNQFCATEVSYTADMLAMYRGKRWCEDCYDEEARGDEDAPPFGQAPPFVPEYAQRIAALEAENQRLLRQALSYIDFELRDFGHSSGRTMRAASEARKALTDSGEKP